MIGKITNEDWQFGELFTRLKSIFSFEVGDGSSLVFTKLDYWLFFALSMVVFTVVVSKRKWITATLSTILVIAFSKLVIWRLFFKKQREDTVDFMKGNQPLVLRSIFLTLVSLFFFYKTSGLYMLLLVISISFNYILGKRIFKSDSASRRKMIIAISALFNVLILGYFKYAYFFTDSFNAMFHSEYELVNHFAQMGNSFMGEGTFVDKILLPVGVSFFTFQNISYVVDIYRKEIEPVNNVFHYGFFVTFFPQLVMGPIVRARDFIPQITQPYSLTKDGFSWASIQILKGLVKKIVIADFLVVHLIDKVLLTETYDFVTYPGFVFVIVLWAYSLHIYADFSGYTDISIGLSKLMGFDLKPNFNSPYKAVNVADFWRRWHISLGSWLRDYLYVPLGGNRTGSIGSYIAILVIFTFLIFITGWYDLLWVYAGLTVVYLLGAALIKNFKTYVHRDLNLVITMMVGGLWHGPSENFVIWGAMNGCALLIFKYWKRINEYFTEKSPYWYVSKGFLAYAIYCILITSFPWMSHIALHYVFYFWMGMATLVLIFHLITGDIEKYPIVRTLYTRFWQIFITFNFITLTRIWFKLDEARKGPFNEKGLEDAQADLLPIQLLDRIWNHFEFTWEYFVKFIDLFQIPLIIMVIGFIIHWLPNKVKGIYERWYSALPMGVQAVCIVVIVFLIYQAIGAEQPPFVYLKF